MFSSSENYNYFIPFPINSKSSYPFCPIFSISKFIYNFFNLEYLIYEINSDRLFISIDFRALLRLYILFLLF